MIRRARREDIPLLMELWQASFGDCMEYISFFFKNRFSPEKTFLYEESGRPVAMLFLLDAAVQCRGEPYTARYLYAACTAQAQRGRGLMRSLIDFAALTAAEEGADCIALVPASPGLFHYYAACGFYDAFYCKTVHFSRKEAEKTAFGAIGPAHALTAAEMAEIRSSVLHGWDHLVWDEAAVHYALNEHFATGGCALCIQTAEGEKGYCLYQQQEESCFAQEFIASERAALPLLSALVRASGARRYSLRLHYAACGFYDAFYCKTVHFSRKEAEKTAFGAIGPAHALTAAEMAEIRSSVLHGWDHLVWDEAAVHYALNEHFATGGCALCIQTAEGEKGYCLYQQQEESCFAQEFIASERAALPLLSALVRASGARRYSLRLPIGMCSALSQADTAAFGMLCPLSPRAEQLPLMLRGAYLGLSLG